MNCLTGESEDTRLSASEMKQLIDNVSSGGGLGWGAGGEGLDFGLEASPFQILEESDIDRDGTINLSEFQHVISRSPDFARYDLVLTCCTRSEMLFLEVVPGVGKGLLVPLNILE